MLELNEGLKKGHAYDFDAAESARLRTQSQHATIGSRPFLGGYERRRAAFSRRVFNEMMEQEWRAVDTERKSSLPPAKLFKAFFLDSDCKFSKHCLTPLSRMLRSSREMVELELSNFPVKNIKHRVEELDEDNMIYKYSIVDGETLMPGIESASYVIKIEPSSTGSVCKQHTTFYTKADSYINVEEIKASNENY
ncbi:hypothetical protein M9H77_36875 [Catharanthus roseus]|uniref:Uncharacterized protein n=1 Tax=Catharanthus roseus TaxID=4058 RepID=A0ACB9ZTF6_CATRO|nr:hypothetical protein M9H77_36875 [Catharanthus roseus]